ncbi:phosphatase PAP2 family protein [Phormidium tenue FACHB-886]|nr:phosphatase PAP2 family protein [Phormidium tenue FACHB-886]
MLRKLIHFWLHKIYPSLTALIAAIGVVGLGSCLLILWILTHLFEEVWERESFTFDRSVLLWIHQSANPTLDAVMLAVTRLGNPGVVVPATCIVLLLLWWRRYRQEAKLFAIACIGGAVLNRGLKLLFTKPRPELWKRLIDETSFSFPSGHALGSVVLYGMIAYLLATHYPKWAALIYGLAVSLILVISFSRLYLGVHWPTDIIAGWGIGFLWVTICTTMLKPQKLQQRSV